MKNQWTIDIKAAPKGGFNYTIHGLNVSGFEVNGGDLVDWFAGWRETAIAAIYQSE